jgi:hypothetical protein
MAGLGTANGREVGIDEPSADVTAVGTAVPATTAVVSRVSRTGTCEEVPLCAAFLSFESARGFISAH